MNLFVLALMLRHDLLITNPLRESYFPLLDSPNATCTRHTIAVAVVDFVKHQIIDVLPVGTKQLAFVRTLPEVCTLEICDSMRNSAVFFEDYPLGCEIVMSADGP